MQYQNRIFILAETATIATLPTTTAATSASATTATEAPGEYDDVNQNDSS